MSPSSLNEKQHDVDAVTQQNVKNSKSGA